MLNETINQTIEITKKISYDEIIAVTNTIPLYIIGVIVWFLPIFFYILVALSTNPMGASGRKYKGNMLSSFNGWIPIFIFGFVTAGLMIVGFYIPIWANW